MTMTPLDRYNRARQLGYPAEASVIGQRRQELTVTVYGLPAPQGSKRHVGHGVMVESSKNVKPWREAVKSAALAAMNGAGKGVAGPVSVEMIFTMPRPKSANRAVLHPFRKPDLSKLIRATEDALTDVGAWEDDARVVDLHASKVFPGISAGHLPVPGAIIRIGTVHECPGRRVE